MSTIYIDFRAQAWALVLSVARLVGPGRRAEEAGRSPEAHGGSRGLRPAVVERGLPAAAARLRAVRRPLLLERRRPRSPTDNFLLRRVRPIFAGTVGRHFEFQIMPDFGIGTTVLQDAWLDVNYSPKAAGPRREVQVAGRPRAAAVGHRARVRRAGLPDGARPQPRRRGDAPRRPRGRRRGVRGRGLQRGSRRRQRRPGPRRREGRGRAPLPLALQAGRQHPRGAGLRDRRHHREADRCFAGLSLGRPGQPADDLVRASRPTARATASPRSSPSTRAASGSWRSTRGRSRG